MWKTLEGHSSSVSSVSFSPDGSVLASASLDKTVKLWRVADGGLIRTLTGHSDYVYSVSFSPDGSVLAGASSDKTVKLWRVADGGLIRTLEGHSDEVSSVSFSPDGSVLASGSWRGGTIKLWRVADGGLIRTLTGHSDYVYSVSFSPDGSVLAGASSDKTVKLWRVADGGLIRTLEGHSDGVASVSFSPDGSVLASAGDDNTIKLWRVADGGLIRTLKGHSDYVMSASFSPDGSVLASGSYNEVKLWRVADGGLIRTLTGHSDFVCSISFSPDGSLLASGSLDNTVKLWRLEGVGGAPLIARSKPSRLPSLDQMRRELAGDTLLITHNKPKFPPDLNASLSFNEPSGNNLLDAGEKGTIIVRLENTGMGDAHGLIIDWTLQSENLNVTIGNSEAKLLPYEELLCAGESVTREISVSANLDVGTNTIKIKFEVTEANGFDLYPPANITFNTKALIPPELTVVDVRIDDQSGNKQIEPREIVDIIARIQNKGQGEARRVNAKVHLGENVFLAPESQTEFELGNLDPGEYKDVTFTVFTNNRATGVPVNMQISEARGSYDVSEKLDLAFNKPQKTAADFVVKGKETGQAVIKDVATLTIDIEKDIPRTGTKNPDAYAVVIGNRDYLKVKPVDYAINDATLVKEYLIRTLGYRDENIFFVRNASKADFELYFGSRVDSRGKLFNHVSPDGSSDVFIYYSGHGSPDVNSGEGYFVPVDAEPQYVSISGYGLGTFYDNLSKLRAKSVTVVLDACFSGSGLLENISPVSIRYTTEAAKIDNAFVFSSSTDDQVSCWYPEKEHGLFTYFFLKAIHDRNGDADHNGILTYGELFDFIASRNDGIPRMARKLHNVEQTPTFFGDKEKVFVEYGH